MKTSTYLMAAALGTTMLAWAGCSNSTSDQPASTNSVSSTLPSTNEVVNNAPPAMVTNAPMPTNSLTVTNQ